MIYLPLILLVLWTFFLAYSDLKRFAPVLRPEVKAVGMVIILIGFLIDVAFNWTIGLLLGVTKDVTFSQKCKRLKSGSDWRAKVAAYLCENWMNPFDSGHC